MVQGKPRLKHRGAEVIVAADACDAARSLTKLRLQSADIPLLPLKTCDRRATCKCKYRHFDDRRGGSRRENEEALVPVAHKGAERRRRSGRRERD